MTSYNIINIREIIYSTGSLNRVLHFFEDYGGWNRIGKYSTDRSVLDFWELERDAVCEEYLLQSDHVDIGQVRVVKFDNVEQEYIRSSQQPWDIGGIMDINLRVHEVTENFENLRELGWHGLSDPMLQEMGPFKLYDILMRGYDDTIIAFTHRLKPPMDLKSDINLPTHVYKSSLTVRSLEESEDFYKNKLGFKVLNQYTVIKDKPQETMFGLPWNLADQVACNAIAFSPHGDNDADFQIVQFDGVTGKDFSDLAKPPNRGFLLMRIEVEGLDAYFQFVLGNGVEIQKSISELFIEPYGKVDCFSIYSPDGALFEFFERKVKK